MITDNGLSVAHSILRFYNEAKCLCVSESDLDIGRICLQCICYLLVPEHPRYSFPFSKPVANALNGRRARGQAEMVQLSEAVNGTEDFSHLILFCSGFMCAQVGAASVGEGIGGHWKVMVIIHLMSIVPLRELFFAHVLPLLDAVTRIQLRCVSRAQWELDINWCTPKSLLSVYACYRGSRMGRIIAQIYAGMAAIGWEYLPECWDTLEMDHDIRHNPQVFISSRWWRIKDNDPTDEKIWDEARFTISGSTYMLDVRMRNNDPDGLGHETVMYRIPNIHYMLPLTRQLPIGYGKDGCPRAQLKDLVIKYTA